MYTVKFDFEGAGKLAALDAEIVADLVFRGVGIYLRFCGLFHFPKCLGFVIFHLDVSFLQTYFSNKRPSYLHSESGSSGIVLSVCPHLQATVRCCSLYRSEVLVIQLFLFKRCWRSLNTGIINNRST